MIQDYPLICDWGKEYASKHYRPCSDLSVHKGKCEKHISHDEKVRIAYDATPREKRQEYLDTIKDGKSIGEACEITGVEFYVALEIINNAIDKFYYLKTTAA